MKKFKIIHLAETRLEAQDARDAVEKYFAKFDNTVKSVMDLTTSKRYEVIGYCEDTGKAIFEGDEYTEDTDGIMILKDYPTK